MLGRKDVKMWDRGAVKSLRLRPPDWFSYYMGNSYIRATEIGLEQIHSNKISLLKTDLWNEGIEYQRDILGYYQNNENFNLYGIDISPIVCSQARSKTKNVHIIQGDMRNLPFRDDSFDILLDLSTLDHIPENQVMDVLHEYKRALRKSGILVLIFWYKSFFVKYIKRMHQSATQYYFSLKSVRNNVKEMFDICKEYCIGTLLCIPYLESILSRLPIFIRNRILDMVLNLEYSTASKSILKDFAGLYVLIARKK